MQFLKHNLLHNGYSWANTPAPEAIFPSRKLFDRFNGWQIIRLINFTNRGFDNEQQVLERGQKIEHLILNKLPLQTCSEVAVCNWLLNQQLI